MLCSLSNDICACFWCNTFSAQPDYETPKELAKRFIDAKVEFGSINQPPLRGTSDQLSNRSGALQMRLAANLKHWRNGDVGLFIDNCKREGVTSEELVEYFVKPLTLSTPVTTLRRPLLPSSS